MKRFICLLTSFAVLFSLCGCSATKALSSKTEQYIVAALGFEKQEGKLQLLVEAVVVGTEGTVKAEPKVIKGEGENINEAFSDVYKRISQPLLLSHCAVIVIGTSLSAEDFAEICDYCLKEEEITLSVFTVAAKSPEKLLGMNPVSSVAVGYDIVGMIEQQTAFKEVNFHNRLYEIKAAKYKSGALNLPFFEANAEEFYYGGLISIEREKANDKKQ